VERLVLRFQDRLYSFALRLMQNSFDAQEVTQDAFVRACRALASRYDESKCRGLRLGPWLYRITRNLAYSRRRVQLARNEAPVPDDLDRGDTLPHRPAIAVRKLELEERGNEVRMALARLEPADRELVLLRFMEEMSYAEIAAIVGTGESAVRGKVFRALRKLRTTLEKGAKKNAM
jgi:RNA polymerase sigma-70 factor (ECF subfamily)